MALRLVQRQYWKIYEKRMKDQIPSGSFHAEWPMCRVLVLIC